VEVADAFLTFDSQSFTLIGKGSITIITKTDPLQFSQSTPFRIKISGTGQDLSFTDVTAIVTTPDGGSALGLLAVGLVSWLRWKACTEK
jgi:hypothetical protein